MGDVSVIHLLLFLLVNIASYHSPSRAGIFFVVVHKTPFIFDPRTLSTW